MSKLQLIAFVLLAVLQLADIGTTRRILADGGHEKNPLLRWCMDRVGVAPDLVALKLAMLVVVWRAHSPWLTTAGVVLYLWVVRHNWREIARTDARLTQYCFRDSLAKLDFGDIIMVRGRSGILAPFTKFFTYSPYTHVGQVFWISGEWWMHEINGGRNHAIPLSQLSCVEFDVYAKPADVDDTRLGISLRAMLRTPIHYGSVALFFIGLFDYLGIKVFLHWRKILVCSGYIAKTLCDAGWPECTYVLSPAALARKLPMKFAVRT